MSDLVALRREADRGEPNAGFMLAVSYELGLGVIKDSALAVKWYELAANEGLAHAQFDLGRLYLHGEGVSRSAPTAVAWFEKAAAKGHAAARSALVAPGLTPKQSQPAPLTQSPRPEAAPSAKANADSVADLIIGILGTLAVVAAVSSVNRRPETRNGQEGEYVCPSGKHLQRTTCYPDRTDIVSCGRFDAGCNVSEPAEWRPKKPR